MIPPKHVLARAPLAQVAAAAPVGAGAATKSILQQYPHSERFRLRNGEIVELPVHQEHFNFVALSGTANISKLNEILAEEDLEALADPADNTSVQIYAIDYLKGDAGAYKEMFLVFSVREKAIEGGAAPANNGPQQLFVRRVSVSTQKPLHFGIDVWGYPKRMGTTTYAETKGGITFSYSEGKSQSFLGECRNSLEISPVNRVPSYGFEFITPYKIRRSHAGVINSGDFATRPFDRSVAGDSFTANPRTALGRELKVFEFEPKVWHVCRNMRAVGFTGAAPPVVAGTTPAPAPGPIPGPPDVNQGSSARTP